MAVSITPDFAGTTCYTHQLQHLQVSAPSLKIQFAVYKVNQDLKAWCGAMVVAQRKPRTSHKPKQSPLHLSEAGAIARGLCRIPYRITLLDVVSFVVGAVFGNFAWIFGILE